MLQTWQLFLNSLDSNGGKIFLLLVATVLGMIGLYLKVDKAEILFVGAGSALLAVLKMTEAGVDRHTQNMTKPPDEPSQFKETVEITSK